MWIRSPFLPPGEVSEFPTQITVRDIKDGKTILSANAPCRSMANIGFFDIPADDVGRAKKFYQSLLGWKIEPVTNFVDKSQQRQSIITGEPQEGSMHSGGLYKRMMPGGILVFVIVEDIDRVLARVEKLGGKILMPRTEIKDLGLVFGVIRDTEGNKLGLLKPA